jgi:hypothetical protein
MQACKKGKFSSWQIQISVWIFSAVAGKAWIWIRGFRESGWPQENLMFLIERTQLLRNILLF